MQSGRHERERSKGGERDPKFDDAKLKESFDMYNKAWETYYSGMGKDRPKSSREKSHPTERRSRSPPETRERYSGPPTTGPSHHPHGMPGPFPGMMPGSK